MEPHFGHDFAQVRLHTDEKAAASARAVNARAYAVGQDIVFDSGKYAPGTDEGRMTLAHELAHTIQQRSARERPPTQLALGDPEGISEKEAHAAAEAVIRRDTVAPQSKANLVVAREPPPEAAPPKKKITVNITTLNGATRNATAALTYANTKVYSQADIEIVKGKEVTLDEPKSKAILGNDLILEEYRSPSHPTDEERALLKENQTKDAVTMYFVKAQSDGSTGESFWPSLGLGFTGFVNNNDSNDITFSHELGHVLLDDGGHDVPDDTYLMFASKNDTKYKLTAPQITKIKGSSFAK